MTKTLETILLLALPASGKSEVRRYLELMPKDARLKDFHMGDSVQLDDFPYVHMMRRIDDEAAALGGKRVFFHSSERPFQNPLDWGTLLELVNEDHEDMLAKKVLTPKSAGELLMERIDRASVKVGAPARLAAMDKAQKAKIAAKIEPEARKMLEEKHKGYPSTLEGKTLVIEFARGGPQTAGLPLPEPFGYRYSLAKLSPKILEKAAILYIWVTPEESRRKNSARTNPNDPGSILHHGVPIEVMLNDYGQTTWSTCSRTPSGRAPWRSRRTARPTTCRWGASTTGWTRPPSCARSRTPGTRSTSRPCTRASGKPWTTWPAWPSARQAKINKRPPRKGRPSFLGGTFRPFSRIYK